MFNIQNKSLELSLLFSVPASLGLILASKEIVSGLFGYGFFFIRCPNDIKALIILLWSYSVA